MTAKIKMTSTYGSPLFLLVTLFLSGHQLVPIEATTVSPNGTILWGTGWVDVSYILETGTPTYPWTLSAYARLARQFAAAFVKKDILWDILGQFLSGNMEEIPVEKILTYEIPFLVVGGLSLLLGLVLPITGLIFCCCRCCCGRCGGRRMDPAKLSNLRVCRGLVMAGGLLLVNLVMITAALCMYPANSRISSSFEVTVQTADNIVDDLQTFLNKTFQEIDLFIDQDVGIVLDAVSSDISDVGTLAAGPFLTAMESRIDTLADSLAAVDTDLNSAHTSLISLNNSLTLMTELFSALEAGISQAKDNLTSVRADCDADITLSGLGVCDGIPDLSSQAATLAGLNFPDLSDGINSLESAQSLNLTSMEVLARAALNSLSAEIGNSTDISVDFSAMHEPLRIMVANMTSGVQEFLDEDKLKDLYMHHVTNVASLLEQYEGARQGGIAGPSVVVLVPGLFVLLGLLLACCGWRPRRNFNDKRSLSSKFGAGFLCMSVSWHFLFSLVICLLSAVLVLVGMNMSVVCDSVLDLSLFDKLVDKPDNFGGDYILAKLLLGNGSVPLTTRGIIEGCREDKAAYEVLKLDVIFDFTSQITEMVNLEEMTPDLTPVYDELNTTLGSVDLNLDTSDLSSTHSSLGTIMDLMDLSTFQDNMHAVMDSVSPLNASTQADQAADAIEPHNANLAADLREIASDLTALQSLVTLQLDPQMTSFSAGITSVNESINAVQTSVAGSISTVDDLSDFIQDSAMTLLTQGIDDVVSRLSGYGTQLMDEGVRRVQEDVGRCQILSNIFDAVVGIVCVYFGEGLNALWLSFAIVVACLVPSIVLSVRLKKYYRRVQPGDEEAIRYTQTWQSGMPIPLSGASGYYRRLSSSFRLNRNNRIGQHAAPPLTGSSAQTSQLYAAYTGSEW
ncbi:PREDICTED: prominin-1-A-like isoform X1 [Branchiostoma belcheri]|uniref:Prominin-1-A-like isoform X1 n=2 Tax=Branchiostoma belcheri TaxID=7741 RepID=A0A6P4Z1W9_BRABE|nr:PREDICTED: prominin-1-A-like isoform X1 [Branchiostoma belcheri]